MGETDPRAPAGAGSASLADREIGRAPSAPAWLRRIATAPRFVRFVLIGLVNTAFGYGLFAAIFLLTGAHRLAIVLATCLGILFNFFTTGRFVFGNRSARALLPFFAGYGAGMGLNLAAVEALVGLGAHPLLAQAVSLPVVVVTAYLINARIVFGRGQAPAAPARPGLAQAASLASSGVAASNAAPRRFAASSASNS